MAKKDKTMMWVIIGLALLVLGYMLFGKNMKREGGSSGNGSGGVMPSGCYPLEEVHETEIGSSEMWVGIIPFDAEGNATIRPEANWISIGDQIEIENTAPTLDGVYTIKGIWYDSLGKVGALRVDTPSGYNFNYNATQGGDPRDITYFGIGRICKVN